MTLANHLFVNKFLFNLCKLYIFTEVYERIETCFFFLFFFFFILVEGDVDCLINSLCLFCSM